MEIKENQGELLQDSKEIISKEAGQDGYALEIDLRKVSEVICPVDVLGVRADVKLGTVEHFEYFSKTTGCKRGANILLPASYDKSKKYPVLFFLHGIFGDEFSMLNDENSKLKEIAANLAAGGKTEEIVIVFPNMYASPDPALQPGFSAAQVLPYDNFINDLVDDLIPYVEENYSAMTDRDHRGIIGFSMGGRESLFIGIMRSDLFSCIGAIAPAPGVTPAKDWAMEHVGQISESELVIHKTEFMPKFLMVCCGTQDGVVGKFPLSYHDIMVRNKVDHIWYEVPGADHDFNAIRSGFYNYLIRWFKG